MSGSFHFRSYASNLDSLLCRPHPLNSLSSTSRTMGHNPKKGLQGQPSRATPADRHILNRLEEYGQNHQLSDIDGALEFLRRNYPEYRRKPTVPFRKYIAMQIPLVRRRMAPQGDEEIRGPRRANPNPEEDRLRDIENAHVLNQRGVGDMNEDLAFEGSDNPSENSDGVESDDSIDSDEEGDGGGASGMGNGDIDGPGSPGKLQFLAHCVFCSGKTKITPF